MGTKKQGKKETRKKGKKRFKEIRKQRRKEASSVPSDREVCTH